MLASSSFSSIFWDLTNEGFGISSFGWSFNFADLGTRRSAMFVSKEGDPADEEDINELKNFGALKKNGLASKNPIH